jgi:uncharacterized protein (DUF924 family)
MTETVDSHSAVTSDWARTILDFWFKEIGEAGWWVHSTARDDLVTARFLDLWDDQRTQPDAAFLNRADEALAAIILFDQMPRHMFRDKARAFSTDPLARDIARGAVAQGYDVQIGGAGRLFFYMPFQHSEAMEDQEMSMTFFEALGDGNATTFARKHRDVIASFGRFPHRNAALGRASRPEELTEIAEGKRW